MTAPSASSGIARADLKVLVACISGTLVSVGGQSFIALTVGVLGGGYGLNPGKAGLFVTLHLVAMAVAAVCMGRWPPGRAAPRVAVGGAAVLGLAYLGLAVLSGDIAVASALIIAGAGAGVAATLTTRAVLGAADPVRLFARANICAILLVSGLFALLPALQTEAGPRTYFMALGAVFLLFAIALAWLPPFESEAVGAEASASPRSNWRAAGALGAIALVWISYTMIWSMSEQMATRAHMSPTATGYVFSACTLIVALGAALAGWADRRFGLVLPLLGCVIGMAACYVGLALAGDVIMYAIVMGWFGLFLGAFSPYMMGFVAELGNDPRLPAGVTSVSIFATAAGPALGGHLAERFGYLPLSLVAAGLAAVACVAFLAVRPGRTQAVIA